MKSDRIIVNNSGTHYYLDGEEVTEARYRKRYPAPQDEPFAIPCRTGDAHFTDRDTGQRKRCWPIVSDALAVHPKRRQEAIDSAIAKGVPTEVNHKGQIILRSPEHRAAYMAAYGYHDRNGVSG